MSDRILVLGGTGMLGRPVVRGLLENGHAIRILTRSAEKTREVFGDEVDVVRKMRIGQLHAAALTVGGLSEIDEAFAVFATPLMFESDDELQHVLARLGPEFERRLEAKGFVLVHWGHAGWVHLFSKKPIRQVADLKQQKLFVWAGQDDMVQWWTRSGFKPVALAATFGAAPEATVPSRDDWDRG